jgi:predicted enzyme related to lactoylglutathione lyase
MAREPVPTVEALDIIQLGTEDVPGTTSFYTDILGATVIDAPSPHWARVRLGNVEIGIHARPAAGGAPHGWEPGFRVSNIAAHRAHLQAHGVTITKDFHDIPGGVTLSFLDPAGNAIGLYQYGTSEAELRRS